MAFDIVWRKLRILGIGAIFSMAPMTVEAADPPGQLAPATIRVVARATVNVKPDRAEIILGVTTNQKTAMAAVSDNDRKMERVLAVLKKEIGEDGEIKTSELSVSPRFQETRDGLQTRHILGYTARNTIRVQVTNIRAAGRLLDLAFQAGANTVDDVRFALKDPDAAQNQALRDASAKARARAHALAEGQGMRVGDVISLSEGQKDGLFGGFDGPYFDAYKRSANVVPMPIEPGSIEVTGTVTVIFVLKPR
jgi:uncharacterized protein YggE